MDPYSHLPPPPAYSEFDPAQFRQEQEHEIPECLRINRKPATTPIVQVRPVYDRGESSYHEPPRQLRHGRSFGNLREAQDVRIARKPVPAPIPRSRDGEYQLQERQRSLYAARSMGDLRRANVESNIPVPELPRPPLAVHTPQFAQYPQQITDSQLYLSPIDADPRRPRTSHSSPLGSSSRTSSVLSTTSSTHTADTPPLSPLSPKSSSSSLQSAFREARHFVGGLVPHPTESTKHFTILRHSHGLVFYQGHSTTLAVTIFSDSPLSAERTIWLQNKGWSGKRGMRAKAMFGANGSWLNVTPSSRIRADQLNPSDERAWQRDITSFQKKASGRIRDHLLRETAIVRIPIEAGDGYFQLVLCLGEKKKILCTSPVFRVVSTSAAPYSIKGASLKTLPLELGALALTTYAQNTAGRVLKPVTMVGSVVQNRVQKYMPSFWVQKAAQEASGLVAGAASGKYKQGEEGMLGRGVGNEIDLNKGPQSPYPIHFTCRSDPATTDSENLGTPTINLTRLPDNIHHRLHGYYFGWCRLQQRQRKQSSPIDQQEFWYQVVFSALLTDVSQLARVNISQASKKHFSIRFVRDSSDEFSLSDLKLEIQLMGFIRPDEPMQRATLEQGLQLGDEAASEAAVLANVNDMAMTLSILDHTAWNADPEVRSSGGILDGGLDGVRMKAQRQISKLPLHKIGLRSPIEEVGGIVSNGFYVQR